MTITLDGKATVATPETGTMFVPRRSVHSFRGFPGEKTVFEERNQPSGEYKALSVPPSLLRIGNLLVKLAGHACNGDSYNK